MEKFPLNQTVRVGGKVENVSMTINGDENVITNLGALMAGGRTVKKVVEALSNETNKDKDYAKTFKVKAIKMYGPKGQFSMIKPYKGYIHFEDGTKVDQIEAALADVKPFELLPNERPLRIEVETVDTFAPATPSE